MNTLRLEKETYYIGAGALVQTVWNDVTERPLTYGLQDIDVVYFNAAEHSHTNEQALEEKLTANESETPIAIDVKNQALVHHWYKEKFGFPIAPYTSLQAAVATWPTTATAVIMRKQANGSYEVDAPFGLEDLFQMVVRPNKRLITKEIYEHKVAKWRSYWPELTVVEWEKTEHDIKREK